MSEPDQLDEATLVARAQQGHLRAFEELVDRYQQPAYRFAFRMLGERQLAEDAVQETLIAVWRRLPTLTATGAFRGWLYQILTHRCADALRRRRRQRSHEEVAEPQQDEAQPSSRVGSAGVDLGQQVVARGQVDALEQVLRELSEDQRACWLLREVHGLSYEETAAALNVSVGSVRGRLNRARRNVSERMASWR